MYSLFFIIVPLIFENHNIYWAHDKKITILILVHLLGLNLPFQPFLELFLEHILNPSIGPILETDIGRTDKVALVVLGSTIKSWYTKKQFQFVKFI